MTTILGLDVRGAVIAITALAAGSAVIPACADPSEEADDILLEDVSALAALPCVAGGPAPEDARIASILNPRLANKMRGRMNAYNTSCARAVVQAVRARGLNERAAAIAIATVIVETSIANLDGGDRDSVGLYQQRATWGSFAQRTDPVWATNKFLDVMQSFYPNGSWNTAPIGDVAADVQRPAQQFRFRYAVEANDAIEIARVLGGAAAPERDVYAISRNNQGRTSVHVLSGATNFTSFATHSLSALHPTDGGLTTHYVLLAGDFNGDNHGDVYAISRNNQGRTSVHILDAATNFTSFLTHSLSALHATDGPLTDLYEFGVGDFNGDNRDDVYAISRNNQSRTSIHILDAASNCPEHDAGIRRSDAFPSHPR